MYILGEIVKKRDLTNKLKSLGYSFEREGGRHEIWSNGKHRIPIPRHVEINEITAKTILKEAKDSNK